MLAAQGPSSSGLAASRHQRRPASGAPLRKHPLRADASGRPRRAAAAQQQAAETAAPASSNAGGATSSTPQATSRRATLAAGVATAAAAGVSTVSAGPARAVQTIVLRDGTTVEAYEHGMTLGIVALRGSVPTQWVIDFRQGLGRYAGFELGQRGQLQEIFDELKDPKAKRSAGAADVVTLGDAWLGAAIQQGLVQPIPSGETYRWWRRLPRRWQQLMRRGPDGRPSESGDVWGCPYRWGATLVAYKKDLLLRRGGRPVRDWGDLLQPQLRGRIAFPASSREFVGIALKTLAADNAAAARLGFNADAAALEAAGVSRAEARTRVRELLAQARAFSDRDHTRTLMAGDTWAVVGTSEDLVPLAERTPSLELVAPASGTSLWADVWAVPAAATGGHMKSGPSPILPSWLEFGVLPARSATLGSLRTGATPLLLPSPPTPPAPPKAAAADASSRRGGLLSWIPFLGGGRGRGGADEQQNEATAARQRAAQRAAPLPPVGPEDAVLGGAQGYLPPDPILLRSEFLLPLTPSQLELYQFLLSRDSGSSVSGAA